MPFLIKSIISQLRKVSENVTVCSKILMTLHFIILDDDEEGAEEEEFEEDDDDEEDEPGLKDGKHCKILIYAKTDFLILYQFTMKISRKITPIGMMLKEKMRMKTLTLMVKSLINVFKIFLKR